MNETISKKLEFSNRDKKSSAYRRIVTGNVNGKSVVQSDEQMPPANRLKIDPDQVHQSLRPTSTPS